MARPCLDSPICRSSTSSKASAFCAALRKQLRDILEVADANDDPVVRGDVAEVGVYAGVRDASEDEGCFSGAVLHVHDQHLLLAADLQPRGLERPPRGLGVFRQHMRASLNLSVALDADAGLGDCLDGLGERARAILPLVPPCLLPSRPPRSIAQSKLSARGV